MIGCYDFCGHYEWTFAWLEREGGPALLREYWSEAIAKDSQRHARDLIVGEGFAGMEKYWAHTLTEESPDLGFHISRGPDFFRIDMHECPSKGFLLRNGLQQHADYCDHCIGWIGPMMRDAGFVIDHEHNHCGQCWWVLREAKPGADATPDEPLEAFDVRRLAGWQPRSDTIDRYVGATSTLDKQT
jgi:hypothetical protein